MSVLDSLRAAMDVYTVQTGPEGSVIEFKREIHGSEIVLLHGHLRNVLNQLQEANRIIGGAPLR